MVLPELPLQIDLFTGSLRDTRTRTQKEEAQEREQPQPTLMFRQRDIAQFGVRARPQMSLSPHTKLALVMEDPRTEEEKERDLQRAAEALTIPLFADVPDEQPTISEDTPEPPALNELPEEDIPEILDTAEVRSAIYKRLIQLAAATNTSHERYPEGFMLHMAFTVLDAQTYGLSREEIQQAMQIGEARRALQQVIEAIGEIGSLLAVANTGIRVLDEHIARIEQDIMPVSSTD